MNTTPEQQLIITQDEIINNLKELVQTQDELIANQKIQNEYNEDYIEILEKYKSLLADELKETISIASLHGWESSRYEQGWKLREMMADLKLKLNRCTGLD